MTRLRLLFAPFAVAAAALVALLVGALVACTAQGFDAQHKVDSVRLFAVRADKPYARPGETVTLEVLLTDQRRDKPRALKLYWIPIVCLNPRDDLYYLCFAPQPDGGSPGGPRFIPAGPLADAGAGRDGGADAGGLPTNPLGSIPTGVDLGPFLPQGNTFSFTMPADAIIPREGIDPYGLAIVFNIACAGKVVIVDRDPAGGPQQVPIQCQDEDGNQLPPSDYVIGISRVYSYATRVNTNPVVQRVVVDDKDVDPQAGITVERCTTPRRADCQDHKIDVKVAESSWEENPNDVAGSLQQREQIWATYYTNQGEFTDDARLLFDTRKGRVSESDNTYRAPADPAEGTIWAVVHDNRGGASWVVLPLHVK